MAKKRIPKNYNGQDEHYMHFYYFIESICGVDIYSLKSKSDSKGESIRSCFFVVVVVFLLLLRNGTKEGKDQESIQSNTTPDPGHHIGK